MHIERYTREQCRALQIKKKTKEDTHIQYIFPTTDIYSDTYLCQLQIYTSANAKCNIRNAIIKKHFIIDAVHNGTYM